MSAVLDDVVVLDLTNTFSAAMTGAFLADFGATVIRLELLSAASEPSADALRPLPEAVAFPAAGAPGGVPLPMPCPPAA